VIEWIKDGDLFTSGCQALVNTVNCEGVMGKGLAAEFKRRWPAMFVTYQSACRNGMLAVGTVMPCKVDFEGREVWVLNFPTKEKWRNPSKAEYIDKGLIDLRRALRSLELKSVAVPALGCANGGLDWSYVRPKIHLFATTLPDVLVKAYEPKE
jgi:O-acetyl-ADP-ribose deacetylase (regulator of RNase III)